MNTLKQLSLTIALTASAAFADDRLTQVASQARELASDYRRMTVTLKDKNFVALELQQELKDADTALGQIRTLMTSYGESNPKLNAAQQKDWKVAQDLVTLLDIFHTRKAELLTGDNPTKKRAQIRAEAQALVTRATLLEQTVQRLP